MKATTRIALMLLTLVITVLLCTLSSYSQNPKYGDIKGVPDAIRLKNGNDVICHIVGFSDTTVNVRKAVGFAKHQIIGYYHDTTEIRKSDIKSIKYQSYEIPVKIVLILPSGDVKQSFVLGMSYSTKKAFVANLGFISRNNTYTQIMAGTTISRGTEGKRLGEFDAIGWIEFSQDSLSQSHYYDYVNLGIGKVFKNVYFNGIVGIANRVDYKNCIYHKQPNNVMPVMLMKEGDKYYKVRAGGTSFNYGIEIGYVIRYFIVGALYTNHSGFGAKFGCAFPLN